MSESDPWTTIDLARPDCTSIDVSVGESDLSVGAPGESPDYASIDVETTDDEDRVIVSIETTAGDHGTGIASAELTAAEAGQLADILTDVVAKREDRSD
ncbi:hypothetical protein [Halopenitus sp. POP-27]|uniref:hypothetical protein n=1 Tax=Halopenitus sp. POP-27 TaxID=2994425 RepID=UPI00246940FA|nr:hypothetical protein [Halopenitus sp. POP-27]